jgi:hypothetical protein
LLTKGAKLSIASPFYGGRFPLHSAVKANRIDLVDEFILQRADVNCIDLEGRTPLLIAALKGFWEVVDALLRRGTKIDMRDNEGNTVLHAAAIGGSKRVVATVLRAGAKANVTNEKKETPLACVPENLDVKEKEMIVHMLKDATEKEKRDEELALRLVQQNAAHETKMKRQREEEAKDRQRREQEAARAKQQREQEDKIRKEKVEQQPEKPRQVSTPTLKKQPSMLSKFRTSSLLALRSKPQSQSPPPLPTPMPKLEVSIRVTTPPASRHLDLAAATDVAIKLPTTSAPATTAHKRVPSPRIDSGFGQKRPSDADKPLPVLDRSKAALDGKRNSSAAELADWLALSKMMDNL